MTTYTYSTVHPILATMQPIALPIAAADIYAALNAAGFVNPPVGVPNPLTFNGGLPQITSAMQATIADIVAQQTVMQGLSQTDVDYQGRYARIQTAMRGLGLYVGSPQFPNAQNGG